VWVGNYRAKEMSSSLRFNLLGYGPAWGGASSLDPACTKVHAHLLFCGLQENVDFTVEATSNPQQHGELPVMQINEAEQVPRLVETAEICSALTGLGHDPDAALTPLQKAESAAYTALVEERLQVALLFSWWEDEANYEAVTRPALAAQLPVPLCYYLPWSMRRRVHSQLARRRCLKADVAYAHGEAALESLATRLSEDAGDFFHGAKPSSVDAAVFAYLNAVLLSPLPNDRIRRSLRAHNNLVTYCERVASRFFGPPPPLLPPASPPTRASSGDPTAAAAAAQGAPAASGKPGKTPRTPKQQQFRRRSRNAVLGALGSALLYALATDTFGRREEDDDSDAD
jgi:metaxin